MKYLKLALVAGALCAISLGGVAQASNNQKVSLCHGTASAKNPYVRITVSASAVRTHLDGHGHKNNPDFLVGPSGNCADGPLTGGGGGNGGDGGGNGGGGVQ